MFSNIRQKLSDLWADQTNVANSSKTRTAPQTSLLEKLGGIFNFSDTAAPNRDKALQQTALRNVSAQINLSNDEINNQVLRQAVREGVVPDTNQSEDKSAFYLSFGYQSDPIEIDIAVQPTQAEIMQLAYAGFADKAGLSEAGAEEFIKQRTADSDGRVYPRNRPELPYSDAELKAGAVLNKIQIYPSSKDMTLLREIKNRELTALEPDAPSISPRTASSVEQITRSITDTLDAKLGNNGNTIGGTINRMAVSGLRVVGDIAGMVGADDSAQTLRNANSDLTKQESQTKAAIEKSGYKVPIVARAAQEAENTPEFLHDIIEGATLGDFSQKETFGATAGKIIGGLNPAGDVRDVAANGKDAAQGKKGSSVGLTASVIGAIPIMGDIAKPIIKANKEVIAEGAGALLKQTDEVAQTTTETVAKQTDQAAEQTAKTTVERTEPSLAPDAARKPRGVAEQVPTKGDPANARAIKRQNESAELLAKDGYDVEYLPQIQGQKNPDFRIEGKTFDCYSPSKNRALNIYTDVDGKISGGQTQRIVLNLEDSAASVDELKKIIQTTPLKNLEEIFIIKDGKVSRFFPFE